MPVDNQVFGLSAQDIAKLQMMLDDYKSGKLFNRPQRSLPSLRESGHIFARAYNEIPAAEDDGCPGKGEAKVMKHKVETDEDGCLENTEEIIEVYNPSATAYPDDSILIIQREARDGQYWIIPTAAPEVWQEYVLHGGTNASKYGWDGSSPTMYFEISASSGYDYAWFGAAAKYNEPAAGITYDNSESRPDQNGNFVVEGTGMWEIEVMGEVRGRDDSTGRSGATVGDTTSEGLSATAYPHTHTFTYPNYRYQLFPLWYQLRLNRKKVGDTMKLANLTTDDGWGCSHCSGIVPVAGAMPFDYAQAPLNHIWRIKLNDGDRLAFSLLQLGGRSRLQVDNLYLRFRKIPGEIWTRTAT